MEGEGVTGQGLIADNGHHTRPTGNWQVASGKSAKRTGRVNVLALALCDASADAEHMHVRTCFEVRRKWRRARSPSIEHSLQIVHPPAQSPRVSADR